MAHGGKTSPDSGCVGYESRSVPLVLGWEVGPGPEPLGAVGRPVDLRGRTGARGNDRVDAGAETEPWAL